MSKTMAGPKKKSDPEGAKGEPVSRVRDAVTFVRSSEGWKRHVEKLADLDRAPSVSDFIDRAVAHYARSRDFDPPPKR
jgi:hypothetical protein